MRKLKVVVFFIIVFGLPTAWYLFLQFFGENQFDLPKIKEITCLETQGAVVLIDSLAARELPNLLARIENGVSRSPAVEMKALDTTICTLKSPLILVDQDGWIRGEYQLTRQEVDRFLAEIDIYTLNQSKK